MEQVPLADWQTLKSGYYVAQPRICSKISGFRVRFLIKSIEACIGLTEQKNVLNDIVSDVRHVKSSLETIKKDQTKQNKASEDMMIAIKENAENIESKHKLVFAMFFPVVIVLAVFAVTLRLFYNR